MRFATRGRFWATVIVLGLSILWISCSSTLDDGDETIPQFQSIQVSPDTVLPRGTALITANVVDPDNGPDTLSYTWQVELGTISQTSQSNRVNWTAPSDTTGRFRVLVGVSDGENAVTDSAFVSVSRTLQSSDLTATILQPLHESSFAIGDTVEFIGRVLGLEEYNQPDVVVTWTSDVQGTLNSGTVDSLGFSRFSVAMEQGVHTIRFSAVVDGIWEAVDEIQIDALTSSSIELHPVHRDYTSNRLTWEYTSNATDFEHFVVERYSSYNPTAGYVTVATIEDETTRSYVDTSAVLGNYYSYDIKVNYESGVELHSNVVAIRTGVYTTWQTEIPDMFYDEQNEYLVLSTPELSPPQINIVDVTANNADGFFWYQDTLKFLTGVPTDTSVILFNPIGFAENSGDHSLYIASQGDPTKEPTNEVFPAVWKLDLDDIYGGFSYVGHTNDYWRARPQFMAYDNTRDVLFATTNNGYPLVVDAPETAFTVSRIQDSRLIFARSIPLLDEAGGNLYVTELGSFPVSLWKYSVSSLPPVLTLDDVNTGLGYNMQDVILNPDGTSLLLANESPEYVQIVSATDFTATGQYETGPGAAALELSDDGNSLYVGVGKELQKWDVSTDQITETWKFQFPVVQRGIEISDDESVIMVTCIDYQTYNHYVFIIYIS